MTNTLDIMARVKGAERTAIWTPEAEAPLDVRSAQRAVTEYNENLTLGKHLLTGDWCIWIKQGPDKPPFPVIGLGPDLPTPEELTERLYKADTRIHGDRILTDMLKSNAAYEKEQRRTADEASGIAAEAYEWAGRDIKGYEGRLANVKGKRRDQGPRYTPKES
jgi:hypothetical protein